MKKSSLEIVKEYFDGWENSDLSKIRLSDNFRHTSPNGTYETSDDFLKDCWQFSGLEMSEKEFVSADDTVCARYKIKDKHGNDIHVCEWFKVEEEKIRSVDVYFL